MLTPHKPGLSGNVDVADPTNPVVKFELALQNYVNRLTDLIEKYYLDRKWVRTPEVQITRGPKYIRIIKQDGHSHGGSAHTFVEISTGNIFKVKTWKQPETKTGPRGNIYWPDPLVGVDWHGAKYLR